MPQNLTILCAYAGDDWRELAGIVLPNLAEYSARHGYGLQVKCGIFGDPKWAYPWQKTHWVRNVVERDDASFYWVLDIDVLITNHRIPVMGFSDKFNNLFITVEQSGPLCGSYLLRSSAWALTWLDCVIELQDTATSEQHAIQMLHVDGERFSSRTKVLRHPSINSIGFSHYPSLAGMTVEQGNWSEGQLLIHLPGMTPQDRVRILKEYQPRVLR